MKKNIYLKIMNRIGIIKEEGYIEEKLQSDLTFLAGKYDGESK